MGNIKNEIDFGGTMGLRKMEKSAYFCPFATNTGDLWSGPPPVGRTVSLTAMRLLMGATGQRRKAE